MCFYSLSSEFDKKYRKIEKFLSNLLYVSWEQFQGKDIFFSEQFYISIRPPSPGKKFQT